ncbi:hypothetical protein X566_02670 [Afipia sp. P52-10]|jgi:uncharacterized protein (DUF2147 family)|uniref:DUF2147 domain-containing protein n=1 Tax=Afipia sp. P52-10 TaxID=1429916 RepID=UPI0003DF192D|nr:DUF2147 domain-containing protein [Afipia sp. P52-10]ETR76658.1 hypothetical protein X566_02670 [Afipia sp. P52-10]
MRTLVLSGTILLAATATAVAADPVGEWLVKDGSARIKIVSCPPALWGIISAEKSPGRDVNNRDPSMKGRPMLGIPILINMRQTEPNLWTGKIYDPQGTALISGGGIYDAKMSLNKRDMLEVRGCFSGVICDGEDWKRITDPNTPPLPPAASAAPAAGQAKGGTPPSQQTKGVAMSKSAPGAGAAAAAPLDPVCSNISSLVPRH